MRFNKACVLVVVLSSLMMSCTGGGRDKELSYSDVVYRMTDLKSLAELPVEGEKSEMWSSYDRASKIDSVTGQFINWDANIDGLEPQYIRKEGENEVLAEMEGPGAIVRMWSASPKKGKVKIYIDGSLEPIIDESFIDYFKPSIEAFKYDQLVYETNARGFNNYVPITYQKSCKIVAEPGWGQYYQFNYISFPKGTVVAPFEPNPVGEAKSSLEKVNSFFANNMGQYPLQEDEIETKTYSNKLTSGENKSIASFSGKGAIASIKAKFNKVNKQDLEEVMRKVVLEIRWDGEKTPSVWTPIGDFFGTSPGWNEYKTLPMGMGKEWAYSYWFMPFSDGAEIILHNYSSKNVEIDIELGMGTLEKDASEYARFHAKWHRDLDSLPAERWPDWKWLYTEGKGRFIGAHLLVWNPKGGHAAAGGPGHWWWGEGDEKFFVDGEDFPSTFGTGTEDYFGYAWCIPHRFEQAFHSQTLDNGNMGYQPMNRWQITDNVPFQKSFDAYLEKYFPNDHPTQYSTVVYWYLNKEGVDPLGPVSPNALYGWETPYKVYREEGAFEAEELKKDTKNGVWGYSDFCEEILYPKVSGHRVFTWVPRKMEQQLSTTIKSTKKGSYKAKVNVITKANGGEFIVIVNGKQLKTLSCKAAAGKLDTKLLNLGNVDLNGEAIHIEISPKNKAQLSKPLIIDYIEFEK